MKDFPVFTTENGVGSLILKEIPYSKTAYIRILDSQSPQLFLEDCVSFCRAVGAESVYAAGHPALEAYPLYTSVIQMECPKEELPATDALLRSVTGETLEQWCRIYNSRMEHTPNAAYMTVPDGKRMLERGDGWFVFRGGVLLGIGVAGGDRIDAVASVIPGAGGDCVAALATVLQSERVFLHVASENAPAAALYKRLGFKETAVVSKWYKII